MTAPEAGASSPPFARCALADRGAIARLVATGPDILDLIHRLSTGDVKNLRPGEGRPTVLTSAKGRIVERVSVHNLGPDGVLLLAGPDAGAAVIAHIAKYTFAERTGLEDRTPGSCAFAIVGPDWRAAARGAGLPEVPAYGAARWTAGPASAFVIGTNGFDDDGVLIVGEHGDAAALRDTLLAAVRAAGGDAAGEDDFEAWRIARGYPARGAELDDEHNPLEAGLRDAISFTKGCYVGQEVVARLNTYKKVSRELIRLELAGDAAVPERGAVVRHDGREVGAITSAARLPADGTIRALAYVKSREVPDGAATLTVGDGSAERTAVRVNR